MDPIDSCGDATRALNVIAARASPGMTAAQIVTYLNGTLMPDDPTDNVGPFSLDYVNSGIAKAGSLLTYTGASYTLSSPSRYVQRVAGSSTEIELARTGAAFRRGYMW